MTAGSFRGKDKTMTALALSLLGVAFAASAADPAHRARGAHLHAHCGREVA